MAHHHPHPTATGSLNSTLSQQDFEQNYVISEDLGKGAFSIVKLCKRKKDNQLFAVKIIDKQAIQFDAKTAKRLQTEVDILKQVNHPHIIPLHHVVDTPTHLFLIMDLVDGGELFDKIVEKGFYTEQEACAVVYKLTSAVKYLHDRNIVHRDLKPENLLVKKGNDTHVMLSDFGLSRILGEESLASTACGTPYYVAPEIVQAKGHNKEVDMWSTGVITYFLLAGFPPFMGNSLPEIVDLIIRCDYKFPSPYWDDISAEARDFVKRCLVVDPAQRITAADALQHPWLKKENHSNKPLTENATLFKKSNSDRKLVNTK